jgi:hypothetical protein
MQKRDEPLSEEGFRAQKKIYIDESVNFLKQIHRNIVEKNYASAAQYAKGIVHNLKALDAEIELRKRKGLKEVY